MNKFKALPERTIMMQRPEARDQHFSPKQPPPLIHLQCPTQALDYRYSQDTLHSSYLLLKGKLGKQEKDLDSGAIAKSIFTYS